MRIPFISLTAAAALALGGCAYGDLGMGLGGYGSGYGYGSPYYGASVGYGTSYYGGYGYGSPYYGAGYGYGSPYYGWYDNYYYPGSGTYVYDSYRRAYPMSTTQRTYWSSRQPAATTTRTANWSGFNRRSNTSASADRQTARAERQAARDQRHQHP